MTRLLEQQSEKLDGIARLWGMAKDIFDLNSRLSALAVHQLGLTASRAATTCDDTTLLRRCGLPVIPGVSLSRLMKELAAVTQGDLSMLWLFFPELESSQRANKLLAVPRLWTDWLKPMQVFCEARGPGSADQRAQVHDLLCRCGWTGHPEALALVLNELQWDTVEVLHFALERLRSLYHELWVPMAEALETEFGHEAVLPLRKLLDPELTLALVIAAPEQEDPAQPVERKKKKDEKRR